MTLQEEYNALKEWLAANIEQDVPERYYYLRAKLEAQRELDRRAKMAKGKKK